MLQTTRLFFINDRTYITYFTTFWNQAINEQECREGNVTCVGRKISKFFVKSKLFVNFYA